MSIMYCPSCKKIVLKCDEVNYTYGSDADGNRGIECSDYVCPECGCELEEKGLLCEKEFKDVLRHASEKDLMDLLKKLIYNSQEDVKEEIIDIIYNCYDYCIEDNVDDLPSECVIEWKRSY